MRAIRLTATIAFVFVLQQAFMTKVLLLGVHPDLVLLLALAVAITGGRNRGAVAGFAAGLSVDVFMTSPLGLSALAYTVVCYAAGAFGEDASGAPWVVSFIAMVGAVSALALFIGLGSMASDVHVSLRHALMVILVEGLIASLVTPLAAWVLKNAWRTKEVAW